MINDDGDDRYAQATTCLIILKVINNDDDGDGDDYYDRYAQATTSGKLGLRVCGFQRYSQTDGAFQKVTTTNPQSSRSRSPSLTSPQSRSSQVDKYIGRKADEEKFHQLLETFFTVRGQLQVDLSTTLIYIWNLD